MIPELAMNPLMPRIVALFDNANFAQFVRTMAVFGRNGTKEAKTDFAFRVYDVDGDGYISSDDLREVLQMMVGADNLDEATTTRIVQKVIDDADTDGDQRISRDEFTLVRPPAGLCGWLRLSSSLRCTPASLFRRLGGCLNHSWSHDAGLASWLLAVRPGDMVLTSVGFGDRYTRYCFRSRRRLTL